MAIMLPPKTLASAPSAFAALVDAKAAWSAAGRPLLPHHRLAPLEATGNRRRSPAAAVPVSSRSAPAPCFPDDRRYPEPASCTRWSLVSPSSP